MTYNRIWIAEWMKLRWSIILSLIWIGPLLGAINSIASRSLALNLGNEWLVLWMAGSFQYAYLSIPIMTGVFVALICRSEHLNGGWKQLLSYPVYRYQVYLVKYFIAVSLVCMMQILFFIMIILMGLYVGISDPIPWTQFLKKVGLACLATLPLAALQMWVSYQWKNFAAPLALNIVFTIPVVLVSSSEKIGAWYPWSQPYLSMVLYDMHKNQVPYSFYTIIGCGFVLLLMIGMVHFQRRDWV
ncbi:ABC transporter permease [Hazenella sp. IB182357]|uniref:ABC transporter permease n=1 Tax=Polycladospora coralii TaxID=2771432 RepID=A0A926NC70_9BACL|nr:ABC transporter permease [Polycladospora coralii]MBD1370743.1 ABC transporter permease [Polycladospora coralii]MBS7529681.1 ABC transporter permease [Polycladospora coralii]